MKGTFGPRGLWLAGGLTLVLAGLVVALLATRSGDGRRTSAPATHAAYAHRAVEVEGREGGEGDREENQGEGGGKTPWGEQVANRAYPRGYVDDRRVLSERRAFDRLPSQAPRSAFRTQRAFELAAASSPVKWANLGPVTPNVAGEASQFFDPATLQGPPTQQSGRVTALAVDPACHAGDCKLWVAAAGGGIWRTNDATAAKPAWIPPSDDLPTNAFGSLFYDAAHHTLYAGSGEPNGSGDSEAGLGLFRSTDFGASWSLVEGSDDVAINRSIGAVAVDPANPDVIYIGTALARHGSSSVNGGRRTPPGAPPLGVYKSTDGGATFNRLTGLSSKTPATPVDPAAGTGSDFFQGGINKLELDPNHPGTVYAAVLGYGLWRSKDSGTTWEQIFHTMNQTAVSGSDITGDLHGDRTEFDLVDVGATTRAYLGDASDDYALDDDETTPLPQVWRTDDAFAAAGAPGGDNDNHAWEELSNRTNGTNGFAAYGWCQNGQCGYDAFVTSPPGHPDEVWLGGSMNYDELPAYSLAPPRSNGRAVIRTTDGGATPTDVTWQDMTASLRSDGPWDVADGLHPDQHAVAFSADGKLAFVASDGGVARVDVSNPVDRSGSCDQRGLDDPDLFDCHELLSHIPNAITPVNDGLADLQFQSLSFNPHNPTGELLGGTQDNGTWSFTGSPAWFESVGGDGGQSGFDAADPTIRYHTYYNATPEVNYHANNPRTWLNTYDVLSLSGEAQSFYTPFEADPVTGGRVFIGLEHVWRSDDHGGSEASLGTRCNALRLDPNRLPCGDWAPLGQNLTTNRFGDRAGQFVVATERAPSDTGTLWAATRTGRVFVTSNADAGALDVSFHRIDTASTPGRFVSGIAIDPNDPDHAWVSYTGYSAYAPGGHVYEVRYTPSSHDATWTDRSYNLGDQPVTGIAFNDQTGDAYASTDFGVMRLPRGSAVWEDAAPGMPKVAVYGLTVPDSAHLLYAATHGRSAYALKLPARPTGSISGPSTLTVGQAATFTASGQTWDGRGVSFAWQLPGTPTRASGPSATFRPAAAGAATVQVTLTDDRGTTGDTSDDLTTTLTKPVTIAPAGTGRPDRTPPRLRLSHVRPVRVPKASALRGRASDGSGIRSVRVSWGDRRHSTARLQSNGAFTLHHRYRRAKRYRITVVAIDKAGNRTTRHATAVVRHRARS